MGKLFVLGIIVILLNSIHIQSQSEQTTVTPVWDGTLDLSVLHPESVIWTADSRTLYFTVIANPSTYYQYHLDTQSLEVSQDRMPTIQLTTEQQAHFRALKPYAYIAPNQDTFVYLTDFESFKLGEGGYRAGILGVGNLLDETFSPTHVGGEYIRWSDDSSAFLMENTTPYGSFQVISYAKYNPTTCSWNFCSFHEGTVAILDTGQSMYDISHNGEKVLFPTREHTPILWDIRKDMRYDSTVNQGTPLALENVIGAAFVANSEDVILAVNPDGLVRYNLVTRETTLIDASIADFEATWAIFSPDNRWLALLTGGYTLREKLYVIPIEVD